MFEFGFAKEDITAYEPRMAMLGWGQLDNVVEGVAEPLFARAVFVRESATGRRVAFVTVELLLVSQAVRQTVLERLESDHDELGLGEANVVLTATHTHSGPSGFSHHFWINLASPGYSPRVFEAIVSGIVSAIRRAAHDTVEGSIFSIQEAVPLVEGVCFNRSWFAFSNNRDVEAIPFHRRDEATDRVMTMLRFDDLNGNPVGMLNWFAVHCTSVHADNLLLHSDNKGIASKNVEAAFNRTTRHSGCEFVAIFAQEAAGDVSPNYRYNKTRRKVIGRYDDDFKSAEFVGDVQAKHARRLFDRARTDGVELRGPVASTVEYVDFSNAEAASKYSRPYRVSTRPARLGLSMAQGTAEGPGPLLRWRRWVKRTSRVIGAVRRARGLVQPSYPDRNDPKVPFIDLGDGLDGRLLGLFSIRKFALPASDPAFRYVKDLVRGGAVDEGPWIPQIVPVQMMRIGQLAVAATPFETTTVSGRRLRESLLRILGPGGVTTLVVSSYANAYVGYLTTFEEYQCQHYEAGYTLFGPWSLAALQTAYDRVAPQLLEPLSSQPVELRPPKVSRLHLERQRFVRAWQD